MFFKRKKQAGPARPVGKAEESLTKGVMLAYWILLLHLGLIAIAGLVVLIFRGVAYYFLWLVFGGAAIVAGSGYYILKKMKQERHTIQQILRMPEFRGRPVEISLLGGAASLRMGGGSPDPMDANPAGGTAAPLLEDPARTRIRDLGELGRLHRDGMITRQEYDALKNEILASVRAEALNGEPSGTVDIGPGE
ncbi:MAG: hypothetical protein SWC96_10695 [Thermodesulfobacteriota bacterium]|nr:hypothetical protein [Thermodesulfobacteriota bacterium]